MLKDFKMFYKERTNSIKRCGILSFEPSYCFLLATFLFQRKLFSYVTPK